MPSNVTNTAAYDTPVRAVVTGGAGFIGSHLVDALVARGDEVTVVDDLSTGKREFVNEAAVLVESDVRRGIDAAGASVVFHVAAQADVQTSVRRPDHDAAVNVVGTVQVLEAARAAGARVVFTSTGGAIYGEVDAPATEEATRRPMSPYGIAKLCAEEYLQGWNRIHGAGHVVLRLANVFGPRQESSLEGGVVSIFLERMVRGEPTTIFGDGSQQRDFVYVGDVVAALLAAAGHDGGVFNVGTGVATSVLDLHGACASVAASDVEPGFAGARLGDVQRSLLDPSAAGRELGWRAAVRLDDGLRRTWDWLRGRVLIPPGDAGVHPPRR
jgi:UDP-glucose 4-epimerase